MHITYQVEYFWWNVRNKAGSISNTNFVLKVLASATVAAVKLTKISNTAFFFFLLQTQNQLLPIKITFMFIFCNIRTFNMAIEFIEDSLSWLYKLKWVPLGRKKRKKERKYKNFISPCKRIICPSCHMRSFNCCTKISNKTSFWFVFCFAFNYNFYIAKKKIALRSILRGVNSGSYAITKKKKKDLNYRFGSSTIVCSNHTLSHYR